MSSSVVGQHMEDLRLARSNEQERRAEWEEASRHLTHLLQQARDARVTFKEIEEATGLGRSAINQRLSRPLASEGDSSQ